MVDNRAMRSGWVTFAGVAALLAGGYNFLSGIAAVADDDTLTSRATEVLYGISITAWGWFWLIAGLVQLGVGGLSSRATRTDSGWASVSRSSAR